MRDKLTERFDRMMKVLFRQEGANLEIGILASEEAQDFIEAHSSVLNGSFRKVEMSETMRKRLERSNVCMTAGIEPEACTKAEFSP